MIASLRQGHTDFLQRLRAKLLHVHAVLNLLRIREAGRRNVRHARVEIAGDSLYRLAYGHRDLSHGLADNLGRRAFDDGDQSAVPSLACVIREDGVELALADLATSARLKCLPTFFGNTSHSAVGVRASHMGKSLRCLRYCRTNPLASRNWASAIVANASGVWAAVCL